jgi:preprotein translocase subunit Sec61beta
MAEKQRMQAPSGMAGLVRYEETDESLIKLKPEHIVAIAAALIIIEGALFFLVK